jgi:tetratricopeptide (TPR) repeat protein
VTVVAGIVKQQGDSHVALDLHRRALTINLESYGPSHPAVATSLFNVATTLCDRNEYAEAKPLLERALTINEQIYGPGHPDVATIRRELDKHWPA